MVRTLVAVGLSVAIPLAALCAPLVHAHLDGHDSDHHTSPVVHAHVAPHHGVATATDDPAVGSHDDEQAMSLQLFVAVAAASFDFPAASPTFVDLAPPVETAAHTPVDVVHGHDPPLRPSLPARAPPAFLS